ncbi:prephenate dehydratase [Moritella sp. 24]|uniref:prephenate dehydratase n=1 Tax=Moritella sp. 24 TaxID=2746230 RepID=UPI001BAD0968|nr:prephenate dehydratase [Moritella sp. 24]QUM77659.1 prephenate dehydratase [Moritella sp. 24]
MADLNDIRTRITTLDSNLLKLLSERRDLAIEVAKSKQSTSKPVRDQDREQQLLVRLINQGRELGLDSNYIMNIYHSILEDSVLLQQAFLQQIKNPNAAVPVARVAFLGDKGSYSNLACKKYFARQDDSLVELGFPTFQQIIKAVEKGQADYGMLPIENTSSGSINDVYDLLQHTSLSIVGELTQPIEHSLITTCDTDLSKIETIYAHPQPFAQCSLFLSAHPHIKIEFVDSSSAAMAKVKELNTETVAAIGSITGGELYGLTPIRTGLANQTENYSRFIVVARKPVDVAVQIPSKTTFIMSTGQQAGCLVEALLVLREQGVNMTKLESRPIQGNPWEEMFYIDVAANLQSEKMQTVIKQLTRITNQLKVLGCYPSEDVAATDVPEELL